MTTYRVKNSLFSDRLKQLRRGMGYKSAESFAERHHFAVDTYKEWEIKGHTPVLNNLIELADIFNVSIDYLLGRSNTLHVENREISDITGLSEVSIEVLRYIKTIKTPDFVRDLSNTEGHNRIIVDMVNEFIEDSLESVQNVKIKNEENPRVYPIDSIFTLFYEYIYSDNVKVDDKKQQFLMFNSGFQDIIESGPALYREMQLKRIERHLEWMRTQRLMLTKTDISIVMFSKGYKLALSDSKDDLFEKFNKYYSVSYDYETNQYIVILYEGDKEGLIKKQISFAKENDKKLTIAHLTDTIDMIEKLEEKAVNYSNN